MKGILSKLYIKDQEMKKYSIIKNNYMSTNLGNKVIKAHKCLAHSFRGFFGHTYEQILQHTNMNSVHF